MGQAMTSDRVRDWAWGAFYAALVAASIVWAIFYGVSLVVAQSVSKCQSVSIEVPGEGMIYHDRLVWGSWVCDVDGDGFGRWVHPVTGIEVSVDLRVDP